MVLIYKTATKSVFHGEIERFHGNYCFLYLECSWSSPPFRNSYYISLTSTEAQEVRFVVFDLCIYVCLYFMYFVQWVVTWHAGLRVISVHTMRVSFRWCENKQPYTNTHTPSYFLPGWIALCSCPQKHPQAVARTLTRGKRRAWSRTVGCVFGAVCIFASH